MRIERYTPEAKGEWDGFIEGSKNGTFLFHRDYMEYHRDRFEDHSIVIRDAAGRLLALLPAHRRDSVLESHGGLTYGGFVVDDRMKAIPMVEVLDRTLEHLRAEGFTRLIYRPVPHIYHRSPSEEDLYCLHLRGASLVDRGLLSVVSSGTRVPLQARRRRALRKLRETGLAVGESHDIEGYWELLAEVLWTAYRARPVHAVAEIRELRARFPLNIRLFCCHEEGRMIAGVLVFEHDRVARSQYIAASEAGKRANALDLVFDLLLQSVYPDKPFFDFGSSAGTSESGLNEGVLEYKESWGARAVAQDTYELAIADGLDRKGARA